MLIREGEALHPLNSAVLLLKWGTHGNGLVALYPASVASLCKLLPTQPGSESPGYQANVSHIMVHLPGNEPGYNGPSLKM